MIKDRNFKICLVAHCVIPEYIQEIVDFYIYEKENILSENWLLRYWKIIDGIKVERNSPVMYHSVACLMNIQNAINLLSKNYKYFHFSEYDLEFDIDGYLEIFNNKLKNNKALLINYNESIYRTDIFSFEFNEFNKIFPIINSWKEYSKYSITHDDNIFENWFTKFIESNKNTFNFLNIDFNIVNKLTQSDTVWNNYSRIPLDFSDAPFVFHEDLLRKNGFDKIITALYNNTKKDNIIVEIGVSRYINNISDGDSTSIWSWFISKYGGSYFGCDISNNSINTCKQILLNTIKENDNSINVVLTKDNGLDYLKKFNKKIDLLYLDTIDWVEGTFESEKFHLDLVLASIDKISVGGFVMFDDTFNLENYNGKAGLAIPYLLSLKNFMCIYKGYQFIFRRDY